MTGSKILGLPVKNTVNRAFRDGKHCKSIIFGIKSRRIN